MNQIISPQNPVIKNIKSLKIRKAREEKGLFYVEGLRIVEEAMDEGADIQQILVAESFLSATQSKDIQKRLDVLDATKYQVPDKVFKELTDTEAPQGILAVMRIKRYELADVITESGYYILLDSIRDPGNMGTIIRTADAAGFSGVIATKGCVDIYNPKVLRSTMGSIFHIPIIQCDETLKVIDILKSKGIKVYASHLEGSRNIFEVEINAGTALVIGSEAEGISNDVAASADELVRIPMPGRAESLNASVAAGIMIFEAVRQSTGNGNMRNNG